MKITTIGLDLAKNIFHLVGMNRAGRVGLTKRLKRAQLLPYLANLPSCLIAMESCSGANYWAREIKALGHDAKLIAPQYVKPYVKGNKNDTNDAEAIAEAAGRPTMRFVPIKSVVQQDLQNYHRQRERLKKDRTALVNQTRGLLAEYGIVVRQGVNVLRTRLPEILEDAENNLTPISRDLFAEQYEQLIYLDDRYKACEQQLKMLTRDNEICQRLDQILGIGCITASATYAAAGDGTDFVNGRHFSAWLGLVPGQHSTGGKTNLLGISKRGNAYLRTLYIHGARAVLRHSEKKDDKYSRWAQGVLARRGHNKACVAVANKMARMAWVVMAKNETYRAPA